MEKQVSVILLCGGQGTRMQSTTPKQFLAINHKLIAHYSFDVFKSMPEIAEIVVVCDLPYRHHFSDANLSFPLNFASPGTRRQDSVFNGLNALTKNSPLVCVHDSARPLIKSALVQRVIHAAREDGAATAGMPIKFTIKEHADKRVKNTPDRSKYWEIQTPQVIRTEMLKKGFDHIQRLNLTVTDDVSIVEHLGCPVKLVEGSYTNIKITTQEDLELAEFLLKKEHERI